MASPMAVIGQCMRSFCSPSSLRMLWNTPSRQLRNVNLFRHQVDGDERTRCVWRMHSCTCAVAPPCRNLLLPTNEHHLSSLLGTSIAQVFSRLSSVLFIVIVRLETAHACCLVSNEDESDPLDFTLDYAPVMCMKRIWHRYSASHTTLL